MNPVSLLVRSVSLLAIILVCLIPVGCVFYPKQVPHYDADCKIRNKRLVLEHGDFKYRGVRCTNQGCIAALMFIPIEALVAGSIVVVGNTVYWLEKEGRCLLKSD